MKYLWNDILMYVVVGVFLVSAAANFRAFAFGSDYANLFGFLCTAVYLVSWFLSVFLFRNRKGWICFVFLMRWITIGACAFAYLAEQYHARIGFSGFLNVMQMFSLAVVLPAYCGMHWIVRADTVILAVMALQAIIVLILNLRLRREGTIPQAKTLSS